MNDFEEKYGKLISKKTVPMAVPVVCDFYEQLGVLVQRKAVDPRLTYQLFPVDVYWEKLKLVIEGVRHRTGTTGYYEWFEYLYNEFRKEMQKEKR